jgi:LysR family transcriptional regulator, glycine cleavage system transcriptional activator
MRHSKSLANVRNRYADPAPVLPSGERRAERAPWLPPLNALHVFEAVGRHLSVKSAAAELCVTPSAVSRQIRALEAQLGLALFARVGRTLALTSAGQEYLGVVRTAFAGLAAGTAQVRAPARRSVVRITLMPTLATNWLAPRLPAFAERHREFEVQILTGHDLLDIGGGQADLAIRFGQGAWPGLRADPLLAVTVFPVYAPACRGTRPLLRAPAELAGHPWLHLARFPQAFRLWLAHAGVPDIDSARHLTFDNSDTLYRAAAHGMGVCMATQAFVAPYLEDGRLVRPFGDLECPVAGAIYLVVRADFEREPAVAALRAWLLAQTGEAPGPDRLPPGPRPRSVTEKHA